MQTIVSNAMVAHLWANRSQPHAANSGRSLYFEGDTIYSYGSHFPIARWADNVGAPVVLFTSRGYSITTSGHKSTTRQAIPPDATVLTVHNVLADSPAAHLANLEGILNAFAAAVDTAGRARKYTGRHLEKARQLRVSAVAYAARFSLDCHDLPIPDEANLVEVAAGQIARQAEADANRAEQRRVAMKAQRRSAAKTLRSWRQGGQSLYAVGASFAPANFCRVTGDEVETTAGATAPLAHVRRALPVVLRIQATGRSWRPNGETIRLGPFSVDSIDDEGTVHAGCHRFSRREVQRLAATIG